MERRQMIPVRLIRTLMRNDHGTWLFAFLVGSIVCWGFVKYGVAWSKASSSKFSCINFEFHFEGMVVEGDL